MELDNWLFLCIRAGFVNKRRADLSSVVYVLKSLDGRDKVTKIIQYGSRWLWWYNKEKRSAREAADWWEKMYRASQSARKCFHLMRTLEEVEKLGPLLRNKDLPKWKRDLAIVRAAAMAVYWFYDNTSFFITAKLSSLDAKSASARSGLAWTIASLVSISFAIEELHQHRKLRVALEEQRNAALLLQQEKSDGSEISGQVSKAAEKQFQLMSDLIRAFCDLLVACNSNGLDIPLRVSGRKWDDGAMGVAGVVSSLCALQKVWPKK